MIRCINESTRWKKAGYKPMYATMQKTDVKKRLEGTRTITNLARVTN